MKYEANSSQELISGLTSTDEAVVLETIKELRSHGNSSVLPELFSLLFSDKMESVKPGIINLLNDIKDPGAVPFFMTALETYQEKKHYDQLVSACWQCGLDFSAHIDYFIALVIEADYYTSLEAFSVVEENASLLSSQQKTGRIEYIQSKLDFLSPEKKLLVGEMISLLSSFSGPFKLDPDIFN